MKIGENVRKIRELRGFSQEYVANKLGVSQKTYSNWESENTKLDLSKLMSVADVLNVDPIDILKFDENYYFNTSYNQGGDNKSGIFYTDDKLIQELKNTIELLKIQLEKTNQEKDRLYSIIEKTLSK
ncbi:MAG: helix-turn-helix domain-containing protein [Bacteroidia bacterium]